LAGDAGRLVGLAGGWLMSLQLAGSVVAVVCAGGINWGHFLIPESF
jgi:hypothetical protein